jgi:hypothetical protein
LTATARTETEIDTGLRYAPGDPVTVHVIQRDRRVSVTDAGAAVERVSDISTKHRRITPP